MPQYTVQRGDTLSGIAQKFLGSSKRYRELQGYSGDPTRLPVGTVLTYGETPASPPAGAKPAPGLPGGDDPAMVVRGPTSGAPPAAPIVSADQVKTKDQADAFINADQDASIAKADEVPTRTREQITADVEKQTAPKGEAPAAPNYAQQYEDLRKAQGVSGLEDQANLLAAQEEELKAAQRGYAEQQGAKPLAQRVVEGRVSEAEKRVNNELDRIGREKAVVTNQLKTKYGVIETMMNLKQMDYDAAQKRYDSEYNRNIQTFNLVRGIEEDQKSDEEKKKDNARSNLQIIANALKDSNLAELSDDQKLTIRRLELQSGLPVGTIEKFRNNNPKADIITSNEWTDASGKQYIAIVSKGADGKLKTENVFLGQGKAPGGGGGGTKPTEAETKLFYKQSMGNQLDTVRGADGYVSPENWRKARKAWTTNSPYGGADFNENFRSYVNPEHPQDYEGFEEYTKGFQKLYQ